MNNIKKFKEFKLNEQILPIPIGIAAMSFINKLFGSDPTKVRLIFPQKNWEKIGNYLMKKFPPQPFTRLQSFGQMVS